MTSVIPAAGTTDAQSAARARVFGLTRRRPPRKVRSVEVVLAAIWTGLLIVVAVGVQWLPLSDYVAISGPVSLPPNLGPEFLGTDNIGRSTLARLAWGARVSVTISFLSTTIALVVGATLGLISVYFRGWLTRGIDIVANTVLAVPQLLLLMALVLALSPTYFNITLALALIFIPTFMRLTRANALTQMNRDYVVASRALGGNGFRLMVFEVFPNSVMPLLSYALLVLPAIIVTEGSLSFLGFGVQPPTPSWGGMIAAALPTLADHPWPALVPCIVLFLTVFSLNTLGDALRIKLDVREAQL